VSSVAAPHVAAEPSLPRGLTRPVSRDAVLWTLAAIVAAGAVARFASLAVQSYHHDEVITAMRVIPGSFTDMLHQVRTSESNPPLYYVLAWGWAKAFGSSEFGLRSLSALFGAATVPVGYLIGRQLASRRTGLILAALIALNPMLIWYSQEARSYSLLVFFGALSMLFFVRALDSRRGRDLVLWALTSALALCSHYFAVFPVAIEAAWLLVALRERRRAVLPALGIVVATGLALLPLLAAQINPDHIGWIEGSPLSLRFWETGVSFLAGETGHVIAEPPREGYALVPAIAVGLALALLALRGSWREWRGAGIGIALGLGVAALAGAAALAGKDYIFERNLLPALVPLLAAVAIGFGASRARRTGLAMALALCVYWAALAVYVTQTPNLQRPDFRQLSQAIGPAAGRRAIVSWRLAAEPERWYLHDRSLRMWGGVERLREVDLVGKHRRATAPVNLPPSFRPVQRVRLQRLTLTRYVSKHPVKVHFHTLAALPTGFGAVGVVLDGPRAAAQSASGGRARVGLARAVVAP
jgi:4-amino-4-deoxy-L-arabinose transferase-like glycosyltransferase